MKENIEACEKPIILKNIKDMRGITTAQKHIFVNIMRKKSFMEFIRAVEEIKQFKG